MKINNCNNVSFKGLQVTRPTPFTAPAETLLDKVNVHNLIKKPVGWRYGHMIFKNPKIEAVAQRIMEAADIKVRPISDNDATYFAYLDDVY